MLIRRKLGFGSVRAGSWIAANPDTVEQGFTLAYHPQHRYDQHQIQEMAFDALKSAIEKRPEASLEIRRHLPSTWVSSQAAFVQKRCAAARNLGYESKAMQFGAWCDKVFLDIFGIKSVVFGPGSLKQAHTAEEWVEKQQVVDATKAYLSLLV